MSVTVEDIPLSEIDVSEFNTRKDLGDGQTDSSIDDLAQSIARHGLLNPITVTRTSDGRYAVVAGQRRLLAHRVLGRGTVQAVVRDSLSGSEVTAVSLIENLHRADMNPLDKARAFNALLETLDSPQAVQRETGVGAKTIQKYVNLLGLAPELQSRLAAGEAKNTEALARLAQRFGGDAEAQVDVWDKIDGFTQHVQQVVIRNLDDDLDNLEELVDQAAEGALGVAMIRNCPDDCPSIPSALKPRVARIIEEFSDYKPTRLQW